MAIVALAGPLSNFALAFAAVACLRLTISMSYLPTFFYFLALLNIGLGMFNLIPIPPLDGSKILGSFLPNRLYYTFMQYERYGMLALMALIILGNFTDGRYNFFRFLGVYREAVFIWMLGVFGIS
jgi:Zn-dependent protease